MATVTKLGPYTRFERQPALLVTFTDSAADVLDISGMDAQATWVLKGQNIPDTPDTFSCSLTTDGTDGSVTVPWGAADPSPFDTAGVVELEVWVSDGTTRYASEIFRFTVRPSVAITEPTI